MAKSGNEIKLFAVLRGAIVSISGETVRPEAVDKLFTRLKNMTPQKFKDIYKVAKEEWLANPTGKKAKEIARKIITGNNKKSQARVAAAGARFADPTKLNKLDLKVGAMSSAELKAAGKRLGIPRYDTIAVKSLRREVIRLESEALPQTGALREEKVAKETAKVKSKKAVAVPEASADADSPILNAMADKKPGKRPKKMSKEARKVAREANKAKWSLHGAGGAAATETEEAVAGIGSRLTGEGGPRKLGGAVRKGQLTKALAEVEKEFSKAGIKGKGLSTMMAKLRKNPGLMDEIAGGLGKGESSIMAIAREAAPTRSLIGSRTGIGDLIGAGGFGQGGGVGKTGKAALAELTKGVGSKAARLAGKTLRTGIPFALFEAIRLAPRVMREVGLDEEFNEQMGAIEAAGEGISASAMADQYNEDKLLAAHKARLTEADPMAMQFLMNTMDRGLPQKLTRNEVSIGGAPANPVAQDQAGNEIARAFMGM